MISNLEHKSSLGKKCDITVTLNERKMTKRFMYDRGDLEAINDFLTTNGEENTKA